jgi:hypothetical protein
MKKAIGTPVAGLLFCACTIGALAEQESAQVEDIYVVRSLRLSRIVPTAFCDATRTGSRMDSEDQYNFQSLSTNTADGTVTDVNVATVGTLHACFGPTSDPTRFTFYAEGGLGGTSFTGRGECQMAGQDFPERGLRLFRCFLELSGLPEPSVGGHLTTNTVTSKRTIGPVSDPPGYVQPSIATVRLWRKRGGN